MTNEELNGQKYIMPDRPGICTLKPLPGVDLTPDRSNEPQMDLFVTEDAIEKIKDTSPVIVIRDRHGKTVDTIKIN